MGNFISAVKRFVTVSDSIAHQNRMKLTKIEVFPFRGVEAASKAYKSTGSFVTALKTFDKVDCERATKNRAILGDLVSSGFSSHHPSIEGFRAAKKELAR